MRKVIAIAFLSLTLTACGGEHQKTPAEIQQGINNDECQLAKIGNYDPPAYCE